MDAEQRYNELIKKLPFGSELDKMLVDNEIDFNAYRNDILEILKPIGIALEEGRNSTEEEENLVKQQIVELLAKGCKF